MSKREAKNWWEQKRPRYNLGFILSGILAYIFIFIFEGHKNFTILAFLVQGVGSWIIIGIANLFYFLGPITDKILNKRNNQLFRERLFNLGFGFSIIIPVLFAIMFIVFPAWDYGYEEIKNKPTDREVCGIYELSDKSKKFLIHQGYKIEGSKLELKSNNQYYFHKFPDNVLNDFGPSNQKTFNQTGEWNVYYHKGNDCKISIGAAVFTLGKKDNRLSVLITIGDPDSREGIVYEKTQNK